jgi:hypothetical protein
MRALNTAFVLAVVYGLVSYLSTRLLMQKVAGVLTLLSGLP